MTELERKLGHVFDNRALLSAALTHSSHGPENYERLEFLGDRVLGLVVGNWLYERFPDASEGELNRRYVSLVRENTLVQLGGEWAVGGGVRLGPGEVLKDSILADCVEALLGALWLEAGFGHVDALLRKHLAPVIVQKDEKDPKTRLQEWLQGRQLGLPVYTVVDESGPEHDKKFVVRVACDAGNATGEGKSKQLASTAAASHLLNDLEDNAE